MLGEDGGVETRRESVINYHVRPASSFFFFFFLVVVGGGGGVSRSQLPAVLQPFKPLIRNAN